MNKISIEGSWNNIQTIMINSFINNLDIDSTITKANIERNKQILDLLSIFNNFSNIIDRDDLKSSGFVSLQYNFMDFISINTKEKTQYSYNKPALGPIPKNCYCEMCLKENFKLSSDLVYHTPECTQPVLNSLRINLLGFLLLGIKIGSLREANEYFKINRTTNLQETNEKINEILSNLSTISNGKYENYIDEKDIIISENFDSNGFLDLTKCKTNYKYIQFSPLKGPEKAPNKTKTDKFNNAIMISYRYFVNSIERRCNLRIQENATINVINRPENTEDYIKIINELLSQINNNPSNYINELENYYNFISDIKSKIKLNFNEDINTQLQLLNEERFDELKFYFCISPNKPASDGSPPRIINNIFSYDHAVSKQFRLFNPDEVSKLKKNIKSKFKINFTSLYDKIIQKSNRLGLAKEIQIGEPAVSKQLIIISNSLKPEERIKVIDFIYNLSTLSRTNTNSKEYISFIVLPESSENEFLPIKIKVIINSGGVIQMISSYCDAEDLSKKKICTKLVTPINKYENPLNLPRYFENIKNIFISIFNDVETQKELIITENYFSSERDKDYVVNNIQPSACRAKVSGRLQRPIPYTYKGICPEPNIQIQRNESKNNFPGVKLEKNIIGGPPLFVPCCEKRKKASYLQEYEELQNGFIPTQIQPLLNIFNINKKNILKDNQVNFLKKCMISSITFNFKDWESGILTNNQNTPINKDSVTKLALNLNLINTDIPEYESYMNSSQIMLYLLHFSFIYNISIPSRREGEEYPLQFTQLNDLIKEYPKIGSIKFIYDLYKKNQLDKNLLMKIFNFQISSDKINKEFFDYFQNIGINIFITYFDDDNFSLQLFDYPNFTSNLNLSQLKIMLTEMFKYLKDYDLFNDEIYYLLIEHIINLIKLNTSYKLFYNNWFDIIITDIIKNKKGSKDSLFKISFIEEKFDKTKNLLYFDSYGTQKIINLNYQTQLIISKSNLQRESRFFCGLFYQPRQSLINCFILNNNLVVNKNFILFDEAYKNFKTFISKTIEEKSKLTAKYNNLIEGYGFKNYLNYNNLNDFIENPHITFKVNPDLQFYYLYYSKDLRFFINNIATYINYDTNFEKIKKFDENNSTLILFGFFDSIQYNSFKIIDILYSNALELDNILNKEFDKRYQDLKILFEDIDFNLKVAEYEVTSPPAPPVTQDIFNPIFSSFYFSRDTDSQILDDFAFLFMPNSPELRFNYKIWSSSFDNFFDEKPKIILQIINFQIKKSGKQPTYICKLGFDNKSIFLGEGGKIDKNLFNEFNNLLINFKIDSDFYPFITQLGTKITELEKFNFFIELAFQYNYRTQDLSFEPIIPTRIIKTKIGDFPIDQIPYNYSINDILNTISNVYYPLNLDFFINSDNFWKLDEQQYRQVTKIEESPDESKIEFNPATKKLQII